MTMNGDHQSLAAAPLDLRTTNRERGTPICKGRVRDALPLAESGASRKRPTDKPSSRLPFRKRPIHVEPDAPTQPATSEPCGHRVPPAEEPIIQQSFAGQSEAENRLVPASVIPKRKAEDGRRNPAEYPVRCLNPTDYVQTVFYAPYPPYCLCPVPDLHYSRTQPNERLWDGIALATQQDEDGDTALHIAVVQGQLSVVYELIHLLLLARKGLDIFNNLRQDGNLCIGNKLGGVLHLCLELNYADQKPPYSCFVLQPCKRLSIAVLYFFELRFHTTRDTTGLLTRNNVGTITDCRLFVTKTPLHLAVITHQANMVEVLLREGADPASLDRNGQTAMHLCCEHNQKECMSVVLSTAAASKCLETRNYEGLSPLHLAVRHRHKHLARMLLDAGADINAMDVKSGQSPLMLAVESSNADMVHFLIENGCDVNGQSYSGNTALHGACGRDQVDTVRLLLKNGADSSLKNYHNDTPVMVTKNKKIVDVLRGRASHKIKVPDHCVSVCEINITESGSPSHNHSRGCSPSTAPQTPHHSTSNSPKTSSILVFPYC